MILVSLILITKINIMITMLFIKINIMKIMLTIKINIMIIMPMIKGQIMIIMLRVTSSAGNAWGRLTLLQPAQITRFTFNTCNCISFNSIISLDNSISISFNSIINFNNIISIRVAVILIKIGIVISFSA